MAIQFSDRVRLPAGTGRADSTLTRCRAEGREFFILRQIGTYANICHDHGRLLAREIEAGILPEILDTIATDLDFGDAGGFRQRVARAVYSQLVEDVFEHSSKEFRVAMDALAAGYKGGLPDPEYDASDVREAVVAIDVGNLGEGFARRMQKPGSSEISGDEILYVIKALRKHRRRASDPDPEPEVRRNRTAVGRALQRLARPGRPGMGCTAFAAAGSRTDDGRMLHGRTFDGAFFAWNEAPVLFLIDERESNPAWLPYAAVGTAGLPYPGGISGLNMAGISVSLHQMSTVNYETGSRFGRWDIAPFVQQRILREARSLDEAVEIVEETNHFAAWTIVVADAKAGKALRIEICGGKKTVAARDRGETIAQTNHFLANALAERNDFFGDAHFTPTFGKWLETRARMTTVGARLKSARQVGTDWAVDMLADHEDAALGGDLRSFGRTVVKAYGIAAHIMRTDPRRGVGEDEVWLSLGDRRPGPHSTHAGLAIDFEAMSAAPVANRPLRRTDKSSRDRERAFSEYVEAFIAFSRPRGMDGKYLGRDPTAAEFDAILARATGHLDKAVSVSESTGVIEIPARYMRARLNHMAGKHDAAADDWERLIAIAEAGGRSAFELHPYEAACVYILGAATEIALGRDSGALLATGEKLIRKQIREHFPGSRKPHKDLQDWLDRIETLRANPAEVELPYPDFVTVE